MEKQETVEYLSNWIKGTVKGAGADGVVLGLSGGIDSAVLAALCVRAVGVENVLALKMPCYSNAIDADRADAVANTLGLKAYMVKLDTVLDTMSRIVPFIRLGGKHELALGNLKARLRMVVQYYIANRYNLLVAGSDDRSESYVGYFTKYGDGACDFAPLSNLTKTEVRQLGTFLGIPDEVVKAPSTPGLHPGQTAEGDLGITYKDIDALLLQNGGVSNKGKVGQRISELHVNTEHKRHLPLMPGILESR